MLLSCFSTHSRRRSLEPVMERNVKVRPVETSGHLIPRVVHQVWIANDSIEGQLADTKYRNTVKLLAHNRQLGNHSLYNEAAMRHFIQEKLRSLVLEAFDLVVPGKYKSDLARLCLLLVQGGVYIHNDILLAASLDDLLGSQVGFLATLDQTANNGENQTCLLNGLVAAASGHPAIAIALTQLLGRILNRDTFADILGEFVDPPVWNMVFDSNLWYSGPCLLGSSLNTALGTDPFAGFEPGTWSFDSKSSFHKLQFGDVPLLDLRHISPAPEGDFGVETETRKVREKERTGCKDRSGHVTKCHHARYDVESRRYVAFSKFLQNFSPTRRS